VIFLVIGVTVNPRSGASENWFLVWDAHGDDTGHGEFVPVERLLEEEPRPRINLLIVSGRLLRDGIRVLGHYVEDVVRLDRRGKYTCIPATR